MKAFIIIVILVVAGSIAAGLFLSGPPSQERRRQFDELRASHLESISGAVDGFYREKGRLPGSLSELTGPNLPRAPDALNDPRTGARYEYVPTDSLAYDLCATFETDRRAEAWPAGKQAPGREPPRTRFQNHAVGRTCFSLSVRKARATPE